MSHLFEKQYEIPYYVTAISISEIVHYNKCVNCKLETVMFNYSDCEYFFLNGKEIFDEPYFLNLIDIPLSCVEFQIKALLE